MSEFAYPLNGEQNYTAEQAGAFFATRGSGVWSGEDNLAVSVSGARTLSLSAGLAWFTTDKTWGKVYVNTAPIEFELPVADGVLDCICRIVVRWNKTQNEAKAIMLQGELASEAVAPLRSTTDEIYDLVLADYLVVHGETEASAANLTDQRLNEDLCGLMRDSVTSIPTAQLQAQAQALMDELRKVISGIEQGSEAMLKVVYDPDGDGVLDLAGEAIGGTLPIKKGGTGAPTAAEALAKLGGISIKKLWENASPSSDFAAQTISIPNPDDYDAFIVVCSDYELSYRSFFVPKDVKVKMQSNNIFSTSTNVIVVDIATRILTISTSDGGAVVGTCYYGEYTRANNYFKALNAYNSYLIPAQIYGLKGVQ